MVAFSSVLSAVFCITALVPLPPVSAVVEPCPPLLSADSAWCLAAPSFQFCAEKAPHFNQLAHANASSFNFTIYNPKLKTTRVCGCNTNHTKTNYDMDLSIIGSCRAPKCSKITANNVTDCASITMSSICKTSKMSAGSTPLFYECVWRPITNACAPKLSFCQA